MRLGGAKSFRAPSARESLFSAWPEKSNPKRGHPAWRFPGIPPGKCVRYGLAFRRHIRVPTKRNRRRADSPTGRTAMPHRRTGAPAEQRAVPARTRCAAAQRLQEQSARQQRASDVASRGVRAGARCSTRGPCAAVRRGRQAAKRASTGGRCLFAGTRMCRRKARPRLTDFSPMDGRKAPSGVAFLFGYFLFGHAKRK